MDSLQHTRAVASYGVVASLLAACGGGGSDVNSSGPSQTPAVSPAPHTRPLFRDVSAASGIDFELAWAPVSKDEFHTSLFVYGGAAVGDFNGNGLLDIFITRGPLGPNRLYKNLGNLTFIDVAAEAGVAFTESTTENYRHSGPVFADLNGNGLLDLFLGGMEGDPSLIFRNNGDGTFEDVTAGSGIDTMSATHTVSAAFGDYDLDGDLDLFLTHWGTMRNFKEPGDTEHLWRNDSDDNGIRFTSVSVEARISPSILTLPRPIKHRPYDADMSLTPTFARLTDSPFPDLLIAADHHMSQVFMNNGDGTFRNATDVYVITDDFGMGSAVGDFYNTGRLDWFVTSIFPSNVRHRGRPFGNRFYRNVGGTFIDDTDAVGLEDGGWGWGACAADFDNDGLLDIFHTTGWPQPNLYGDFTTDASRLFMGDPSGHFREQAAALGLIDFSDSRAAICADLNNNGFTDVLVLHNAPGRSFTLWENVGNNNNYLRVELKGLPPNTQAVGARVRARTGAVQQMREVLVGGNYLSQVSVVQVFGIGSQASVDEIVIEWPDQNSEPTVLTNVAAQQTLVVAHPGRHDVDLHQE